MAETIPMDEVKRANRDAGFHFFDPDTSRFFHSRYSRTAIRGEGGTWFVTSEQREPYARSYGYGLEPATPRFWNVRRLNDDGTVSTIDAPGGTMTRCANRRDAARLATMLADGFACLPSPVVGRAENW